MKQTKENNLVFSLNAQELLTPIPNDKIHFEEGLFDDTAFMSAMILLLMGNYSQSGHFGGPLAYTPYTVALHLAPASMGGLRYDLAKPKHPFADKFLLAGGHCIPCCYSLWMILYEALLRQYQNTGKECYRVDPTTAILSIDALGFRRSRDSLKTLLSDNDLSSHELFQQARLRGIRPLSGHSESTDVTNDVNGGPSGIGVSTAVGKALFWDFMGADSAMKVVALEGEFAMTEGHAQEMKSAAVAQQVGKRLRILLSYNNAGIDDTLLGGVINPRISGYSLPLQWASYGWNVFSLENGNDFSSILTILQTMEQWPTADHRPMIVIGRTTKGWWPKATDGVLASGQVIPQGFQSHPYAIPMNSQLFIQLAQSFEQTYGISFEGIRDGKPATEQERLLQFKTNIDKALSVLDRNPNLCQWLADTAVEHGQQVRGTVTVAYDGTCNPFNDMRLKVENLPTEPITATVVDPKTKKESVKRIELFCKPGEKKGARRAISELCKYLNYVSNNRFLTIAADLAESINIEHGHFFGHYDPVDNPAGTRLKAAIQEAVNTATIYGLVSQTVSEDPAEHAGVWGLSGTYGAFTPLMYTPARIFSQQNQDSPFRLGVMTILAGHSGPETAADGRSHFGIFAPGVWNLFPRGQVINLYLWDYNDVAPAYAAALQAALVKKETGLIVIHVARPDTVVVNRANFADTDLCAAAKGLYVIKEYDPGKPACGTVLVQGSSATQNAISAIARLNAANVNVRIISVVSPELFNGQSPRYRDAVLPTSSLFDCMVVSTFSKRTPPLPNLGPLTEEYSLYADFDDRWRTCGTEADVIAEAHLDVESIFQGISRFGRERRSRLTRQKEFLMRLESLFL
ncbi:MAG: hypothetical protein JW795_04065 [Chitinivibrionales bacterium]|nr:hypothetical protein [Chitinivibrionales bacterium]